MKKIDEEMKFTFTIGQLKRLVKESSMDDGWADIRDRGCGEVEMTVYNIKWPMDNPSLPRNVQLSVCYHGDLDPDADDYHIQRSDYVEAAEAQLQSEFGVWPKDFKWQIDRMNVSERSQLKEYGLSPGMRWRQRHAVQGIDGEWYNRHPKGPKPIDPDKFHLGKSPKDENQALYFLHQMVGVALGKLDPPSGASASMVDVLDAFCECCDKLGKPLTPEQKNFLEDKITDTAAYPYTEAIKVLSDIEKWVGNEGMLQRLRERIIAYYKHEKGTPHRKDEVMFIQDILGWLAKDIDKAIENKEAGYDPYTPIGSGGAKVKEGLFGGPKSPHISDEYGYTVRDDDDEEDEKKKKPSLLKKAWDKTGGRVLKGLDNLADDFGTGIGLYREQQNPWERKFITDRNNDEMVEHFRREFMDKIENMLEYAGEDKKKWNKAKVWKVLAKHCQLALDQCNKNSEELDRRSSEVTEEDRGMPSKVIPFQDVQPGDLGKTVDGQEGLVIRKGTLQELAAEGEVFDWTDGDAPAVLVQIDGELAVFWYGEDGFYVSSFA